ncbi:MAG: adenylate cyclase [Acidimicrobiia bacterium]
MTTAKNRSVRLSDEAIAELLALAKGADSIELKASVCDSQVGHIVNALELDALDAQVRQVFFFDTPDLRLNEAGVVARARRIQGKGGDTVVKLRPVVPDQLPESLRMSPAFGIEVDAMPGGFVCSASMKGKGGINDAREVALGQRPIKKLFTKEQRAFFTEHAPEGLGLDDLSVLGPIFVLKLKSVPPGYERPLVGEMWFYPDNTRILELSTKCLPSETFQVAAETIAYLSGKGVDVSGEQQTKTKTALEYFAQQEAARRIAST